MAKHKGWMKTEAANAFFLELHAAGLFAKARRHFEEAGRGFLAVNMEAPWEAPRWRKGGGPAVEVVYLVGDAPTPAVTEAVCSYDPASEAVAVFVWSTESGSSRVSVYRFSVGAPPEVN
jgi:hypothetical protein